MSSWPATRAAIRAWTARPRRRAVRLVLAVAGVAIGVGLLSAVLMQQDADTRGAESLYRGLAGRAAFVAVARSPLGMPAALTARLSGLRSVRAAVPTVDDLVGVDGAHGWSSLWLVGVPASARELHGSLSRFARLLPPYDDPALDGLYLSQRLAADLGVRIGDRVRVRSLGGVHDAYVADVFGAAGLGSLGSAPVALAPLGVAQRLAGSQGRVSRIAIVASSNTPDARRTLQGAVGSAADVEPASFDATAEAQASSLDRNSSSLFAGLCVVVGVLLAYVSISLMAVERRPEVATLAALGCARRPLLAAMLSETLVIGAVASVIGLALGRLALNSVLPSPSPLLASAFIVVSTAHLSAAVAATGVAAGMLAALAAAVVPARELTRVSPAEALAGERVERVGESLSRLRLLPMPALFAAGGAALALSGQAIVGVGLLVVAGLLSIPVLVPVLAGWLRGRIPHPGGPVLIGVAELVAFPTRAAALVATVTLAVCGTTIISGTATDLSFGIAKVSASTYSGQSVFIRPDEPGNAFLTEPVDPSTGAKLARIPGVASVYPWRALFIDWNGRRTLAFGYDASPAHVQRHAEFTTGNGQRPAIELASAPAQIALSSDASAGAHAARGSSVSLPTPAGVRRLRVVAGITNYGWAAGAVTISPSSVAAWWGSRYVTAFELQPRPGVTAAELARRLRPMLARQGLTASTAAQMRAQAGSDAHAQLATVSRIGSLIGLAGVLAVAAAAILGVLARARRLASLRSIGMSRRQVVVATSAELACVVLIGALVGVGVGAAGRVLAVHYLASSVSLPVSLDIAWPQFLRPVLVAAAIGTLATLIAVHSTLRLQLTAAFNER